MRIKQLLKISFSNLKHHKIRSLLTILGIIVGIASIIATLAIGYGAEKKIRNKILSMGQNFIFVHSGGRGIEGKTKLTRRKQPNYISKKDVEIFLKQCPEIKKITPCMFAREIVSYKGTNVIVDIKCGNKEDLAITGRKIQKGTFFTKHQYQKSSKVVVLGSKTAKELFHTLDPLGKTIKIKNVLFRVIGVVKEVENFMGQSDPNLDIYMPLTTGEKQIFYKNNQYIHGIAISAKKREDMSTITRRLRKILRFKHNLDWEEPDDFTIYDQQAMVKTAKQSSSILNVLLLIIASISLIVGGIGVMNIMLVSVSERTQEIGIRMAIGATTNAILKQFILESIILCFIGGVIGIILGIIVPFIVSFFTKWLIVIKPFTIILAFSITFIIGLIFGFYPAKKAAKLNVIDALQDR